MNDTFLSTLEAPQWQGQFQHALSNQFVGIYEQCPRRHVYKEGMSAFVFKSIADLDPDIYAQKQPEEPLQSMSEQLITLQRFYTFLSDGSLIADVLMEVPPVYSLLIAAIEPLRIAFGENKLLQLEALASDDDTVLRVIVKLSHGKQKPAALMRKFKLHWWLKHCSRSQASLVFDYEIGDGF